VTLRTTLVASALAVCAASEAAAATTGNALDDQELRTMGDRSAHAVELLKKGQARAAAGAFAEADALFRHGENEYPDGSLLFRADCEALTALGRRREAVEACASALERMHSNPNVLALVRALVGGPTPPTTTELFEALSVTAAERDRAPEGVTPAAAACIIAESLGDGVMLQHCSEELEHRDPNDPEARHALDVLAARCPPWRFWTGWGLLATAAFLTLGHALWRRARRLRRRAIPAAAALLSAMLCMLARTAHADDPPAAATFHAWLSKWPVDEAHPESSVPSDADKNADPLQFGYWLQDLALKAEQASDRGDHAAAVRFYGALAQAVPDRAVAFLRMCQQYEALGDRDRAIESCGQALLRDGLTVDDYTHFVHLVLSRPGPLGDKERLALVAVLDHMRGDPAARGAVDGLECEVGVKTSNVAQLEECTAALAARSPGDPKTLSYLWALAMDRGKLDEAAQIVEQARAAGVPAESLDRMRRTIATRASRRRTTRILALGSILLLLGAIALLARARLQRRHLQPATSA
jgi:tetratricopeptide (TPR) repeat protein